MRRLQNMTENTMSESRTVWLTAKIKNDLERIAQENEVRQEALINVILRLTFSDDQALSKVIKLIKSANLGGEIDLAQKGW